MSGSGVMVSEVAVPVAGGRVRGLQFRPPGDGPFPAVVLGAEATGINRFIREVGIALAEAGFVAMVYDFFRGDGPEDPDDHSDVPAILRHIDRLDFRRATFDMLATVDFVRAEPDIDPLRVFAWGYCTGATIALLAGCLDRTLAGTVLFYPSQPVFETLNDRRPSHPIDLLWNHRSPMLLLYGDHDEVVPVAMIDEMARRCETFGVQATIKVYPGAGHVFAGRHFGDAYRAEAAEDAWRTALDFTRRVTTAGALR